MRLLMVRRPNCVTPSLTQLRQALQNLHLPLKTQGARIREALQHAEISRIGSKRKPAPGTTDAGFQNSQGVALFNEVCVDGQRVNYTPNG